MWLPPGEPSTATTLPFSSNTMVGAMELRGRLPGADGVGDGASFGVGRQKREIGQLVVQQKARGPVVRAERAFDGRRHGDGIAVIVDDGDVAGAGALVGGVAAEGLAR